MRNSVLGMGLMVFALSCQPADSRLSEPSQVPETTQERYAPPPPVSVEAEQMPLKASRVGAHDRALYSVVQSNAPIEQGQKLVRTAHLRLQVKDYEKSTRLFQEKIKTHQAYVTNGTEERQGDHLENQLFIRVDNRYFDALVADLLQESIFLERKNIQVADVTEEYIDHQARLQTRKKVAKRYLELLDRARTVKDILQVEQQLSNIQEEIEAAEARLKYLDHQVAYSTINLSYYEKIVPAQAPENNFVRQVGASLLAGWGAIRQTVLLLLSAWPLLLVLVPAGIWTWRLIRRRRQVAL